MYLIPCLFFSKVCDDANNTHASSDNAGKNSEEEKPKSLFFQALNLTEPEKTRLREVFANMTKEAKEECTPKNQQKEQTAEVRVKWVTWTDAEKIAHIQDKWATKNDEEKACALHIRDH